MPVPLNWILEQIAKEWAVISQAPFLFLLACVAMFVGAYLVVKWQYGETLALLRTRNEALTAAAQEKPNHSTKDQWLDKIAEEDRLGLNEFVYVARCKLTMVLEGDSPHLFFNFYVINCAVYAVTFDPVFDGFISYADQKLERDKIADNTYIARNLPHGWCTDFYLRQELSRAEADFIANDPNPKAHRFSFHNLRITVRGDSTHRTVPPTTLKINYVLRDGSVNIL